MPTEMTRAATIDQLHSAPLARLRAHYRANARRLGRQIGERAHP
jgi:hypothetical protein